MSKSKDPFDPRGSVEVTRADKRGDHLRVEGVAEGRKVSIEIPQPSLDHFKTEREREAFMRRGLLGAKHQEDREQR